MYMSKKLCIWDDAREHRPSSVNLSSEKRIIVVTGLRCSDCSLHITNRNGILDPFPDLFPRNYLIELIHTRL